MEPFEIEVELLQSLTAEQRVCFQSEYNVVRKDPTTALLLALFLGGLGIHHFYLNKIGLGILYLIFSWTLIPLIVALIECFFIRGRVRRYNAKKAREIASQVQMLHSKATGAAA